MSKQSVSIPVNSLLLKRAIVESQLSMEAVAEKLGVSRQALSGWITAERIPPRRMSDLVKELDLSVDVVKRILDKEESAKDYAREVIRLRHENEKLKEAIQALIGEQ